jgi:hypothetical protein
MAPCTIASCCRQMLCFTREPIRQLQNSSLAPTVVTDGVPHVILQRLAVRSVCGAQPRFRGKGLGTTAVPSVSLWSPMMWYLTTILWMQEASIRIGAAPSLPCRHLARVRARDEKLLRRELALARSRGHRTIHCPCRVCNRSLRTEYALRTVANHIQNYAYHDWQWGSTVVRLYSILHFTSMLFPLSFLSTA